MCLTDHGRNVILFIGRGLAYRKTEETDFCWTSYSRNGVLLIGRGVAYRKTEETDLCWSARSKRGSCSSGGVWRTAKRDSTGYCQSPPSTSSSLHGVLFIHRRPPLASTYDCSSTGSCSSSLHCALLHRLLLNQPSPRVPVQPPLHGLLFIQPSTVYCSTSPPQGPVHPAPTGTIDRGPVYPEATPRGPVHPPHRELFIQTPQQRSLFIQMQHRSASVSSSSEGITVGFS